MKVLRSFLSQLVLLLAIFTATFLMIRSLPGDPAETIAGPQHSTPEALEKIRERLGLNLPLHKQYVLEFKRIFFEFDLGHSYVRDIPVSEEMWPCIPATFELSSLAIMFALLMGLPLGVLAAKNRGSWFDVLITQFSLLGVSVPVFLLGYLLILFFEDSELVYTATRMKFGKEYDGYFYFWGSLFTGDWESFKDAAAHIVLPAIALSTIPMSIIMRLTRSAFLDVLGEDYLRTAKAKGLGDFKIYFKHALKVVSTTLVTVVGLQIGMLMSGAVLTESVFSWPGMGTFMIQAIEERAYPTIQACILFFAMVFIVVHFVVDFLYIVLDPRIKIDS